MAFVSALDDHGNEIAGVRLPQLVEPVATYTGWNVRPPIEGLPDLMPDFLGSRLPFPEVDVRERYADRADYEARARRRRVRPRGGALPARGRRRAGGHRRGACLRRIARPAAKPAPGSIRRCPRLPTRRPRTTRRGSACQPARATSCRPSRSGGRRSSRRFAERARGSATASSSRRCSSTSRCSSGSVSTPTS